jgi:hypothetical protein
MRELAKQLEAILEQQQQQLAVSQQGSSAAGC